MLIGMYIIIALAFVSLSNIVDRYMLIALSSSSTPTKRVTSEALRGYPSC